MAISNRSALFAAAGTAVLALASPALGQEADQVTTVGELVVTVTFRN